MEILTELFSEGYVKGFLIRNTKTVHYVAGLDEITITMKEIEYLQDNSKMEQVYNTLKEIRDWVSGI